MGALSGGIPATAAEAVKLKGREGAAPGLAGFSLLFTGSEEWEVEIRDTTIALYSSFFFFYYSLE